MTLIEEGAPLHRLGLGAEGMERSYSVPANGFVSDENMLVISGAPGARP
jgi:hypothetical protein